MYLHESNDFKEILNKTHEETGLEPSIIEKDYYVSMMLKNLSRTKYSFIFKGGTSLSKAYKVINRFSEDIDLTITQKPTQGERVGLATAIMECAKSIGLTIINRDKIRRRGQFNRFVFEYSPITEESSIMPQIVVESYLTLLAFPVENKQIDSFIGNILNKYNKDILIKYNLESFDMPVQSIKRTLIDKVFALCDYYLAGKSDKYSRHIYDIYQIINCLSLSNIDKQLITCVRKERQKDERCLSAKNGIDIEQILMEIINNHYYAKDYEERTLALLFDEVSYSEAIKAVEQIIQSNLFSSNH